jgi:hypothetical protein
LKSRKARRAPGPLGFPLYNDILNLKPRTGGGNRRFFIRRAARLAMAERARFPNLHDARSQVNITPDAFIGKRGRFGTV